MRDRVLGKNGFEPFPKRLEEQAIKQGQKAAPAKGPEAEDLIQSAAKAKAELLLKMNEDAKKQAEMDKLIKEREAAKAAKEKAEEEAKAAEQKKIEEEKEFQAALEAENKAKEVAEKAKVAADAAAKKAEQKKA